MITGVTLDLGWEGCKSKKSETEMCHKMLNRHKDEGIFHYGDHVGRILLFIWIKGEVGDRKRETEIQRSYIQTASLLNGAHCLHMWSKCG